VKGVTIVTATYNERENIPKLVKRIRKVLSGIPNEIIVVDDSSPDGTYDVARKLVDLAVKRRREGQTKCLLLGIKLARYPIVVTIDADLENPPELIPKLLEFFNEKECDLLIASRRHLPRFSEILASKTLGVLIEISDVFSNFRVYKKECMTDVKLKLGETFGAELLVIPWSKGYEICEYLYDPPPRRRNPRIGGKVKANLRIIWALIKTFCLITYLAFSR